MSTALVLVDIQNDYFPGGAMALVGMTAAARNAASLLARYRDLGHPIVHIQHLSTRPGATFFLPGTPGVEHHASVAPRPNEPVIQKHFPNSFRGSALQETLQKAGVTDLLVVGAMSHMCIDATVRAAFDLGYQCAVAQDACATRDLQYESAQVPADKVHAAFMAALASPYANVAPTAALLAAG
jgi:nicotinamidase-related amidase